MTNQSRTRSMVYIGVFVALICICAMISIPVGNLPITMQLFGIYMALYALGGVKGSLAVFVYILVGAVGLPVFSGFSGGFARFFDQGGGFIYGFLLLSLVYSILHRLLGGRRLGEAFATGISLICLYAVGAVHYAVLYLGGIDKLWLALLTAVVPYIAADVLKILLAFHISGRISGLRK